MKIAVCAFLLLLILPMAALAEHVDFTGTWIVAVPGSCFIGDCTPRGFNVAIGDPVTVNFGYDTGGTNPYLNIFVGGTTYNFPNVDMRGLAGNVTPVDYFGIHGSSNSPEL